jgi:F-box-like
VSYPNDCWLIRCDYVGQVITIDVLPDDVLLTIFDFYVVRYQDLDLDEVTFSGEDTKKRIDSWQSLVHVCRRWRGLVFASPRRLNMQLFCIPGPSTKRSLDVWPALPLLILGDVTETSASNVIAELEYSDRIYEIKLLIKLDFYTTSQIEKLWTAMQVPFPELAALYMSVYDLLYAPVHPDSFLGGSLYAPVLPDSFLGGSAPRLRYLALHSIPFPGLPNLLLSATHLVELYLNHIPHSGYFSPEAMVTCLTTLTNLQKLQLGFESPQSCPDQENRRSPPPIRSVLPVFLVFWFKGVNEYLEELVAWIDAPQLIQLEATFFNDIEFDTPELIRFVSHSSTIKALDGTVACFDNQTASVRLIIQASGVEYFEVQILSRNPDWQLSSLAQICTTPLFPTTENLFIREEYNQQLAWKDGIENIEWLELLLPFTAVKNLYLSKQFAPRIAPALQEMTVGGTTEVLPTLENLYLEGFQPSESVEEGIERFISARQLTNRPVAISVWDRLGADQIEVDD